MSEHFISSVNEIVERAKTVERPMRAAIAAADAENIVKGAFLAQDAGFVEPILIGNEGKIRAVLERTGMADREVRIIDASGGDSSVQYAIEMINAGEADCLMRGNSSTRDFLMPVLNKSNHLVQPDMLVTHIDFMKIPDLDHLLAVSDVTLLVDPSIQQRKEVIKNMVRAFKAFGVEKPEIALLSLVEKPSYHMRNSVECETIARDNIRSPFADCNLVGPIPYDLIISKEAARLKGYDCPYCGEFDGIVVPNLVTGNVMVKILQHSVATEGFGVLMGAKIPIAITSRSDRPEKAFASLAACAVMWGSPDARTFYDK